MIFKNYELLLNILELNHPETKRSSIISSNTLESIFRLHYPTLCSSNPKDIMKINNEDNQKLFDYFTNQEYHINTIVRALKFESNLFPKMNISDFLKTNSLSSISIKGKIDFVPYYTNSIREKYKIILSVSINYIINGILISEEYSNSTVSCKLYDSNSVEQIKKFTKYPENLYLDATTNNIKSVFDNSIITYDDYFLYKQHPFDEYQTKLNETIDQLSGHQKVYSR